MISCIVADTLLLAHTLCGVLGILRTRHVRGLSPVAVSGCQKRTVVRRRQGSDGSGLGVLRGFRAFGVLVRGIAFLLCDDSRSPLQRGIEVESCRSERSCGTGTQLYALDVLRGVELLLRFCSLFVLDAD